MSSQRMLGSPAHPVRHCESEGRSNPPKNFQATYISRDGVVCRLRPANAPPLSIDAAAKPFDASICERPLKHKSPEFVNRVPRDCHPSGRKLGASANPLSLWGSLLTQWTSTGSRISVRNDRTVVELSISRTPRIINFRFEQLDFLGRAHCARVNIL